MLQIHFLNLKYLYGCKINQKYTTSTCTLLPGIKTVYNHLCNRFFYLMNRRNPFWYFECKAAYYKYRNVIELCSNEIFILENEDTPT